MSEDSLSNLEIFQDAIKICDLLWNEVSDWKQFQKNTVGIQLVRAADSIGANIAEGYGRHSYSERLQFLYYARGSLYETIYWLNRVKIRNLLVNENLQEIDEIVKSFPQKLNKYIAYIKSLKSKK